MKWKTIFRQSLEASVMLLSFFLNPFVLKSQVECPPNQNNWDCEEYQTFRETVFLDKLINPNWDFPECPIEILYGISRCIDLGTGQIFYQYWGPTFKFDETDPKCSGLHKKLLDANGNYDSGKLLEFQKELISIILVRKFQENPVPCPNQFTFIKTWDQCFSFVRNISNGEKYLVSCGGEGFCCETTSVCEENGRFRIKWETHDSSSPAFCPQYPPSDPDYEILTECDRICK